MENQFIPYHLAVKMKELSFDEKCFAYYDQHENLLPDHSWSRAGDCGTSNNNSTYVAAPLWQQAFDWLRKEHELVYVIEAPVESESQQLLYAAYISGRGDDFEITIEEGEGWISDYNDARLGCLEKMIELTIQNTTL